MSGRDPPPRRLKGTGRPPPTAPGAGPGPPRSPVGEAGPPPPLHGSREGPRDRPPFRHPALRRLRSPEAGARRAAPRERRGSLVGGRERSASMHPPQPCRPRPRAGPQRRGRTERARRLRPLRCPLAPLPRRTVTLPRPGNSRGTARRRQHSCSARPGAPRLAEVQQQHCDADFSR
ncbi:unnamed protein product [Coccothraustes coccothraustes]